MLDQHVAVSGAGASFSASSKAASASLNEPSTASSLPSANWYEARSAAAAGAAASWFER